MWLSIDGPIGTATARSLMLYDSKAWPLGADVRRLPVFAPRRLCTTGRMWWKNFVSNSEVRLKVLGSRVKSLEQAINQNRSKWLGHILHISTEQLLRCTLSLQQGNGWKVVGDYYGWYSPVSQLVTLFYSKFFFFSTVLQQEILHCCCLSTSLLNRRCCEVETEIRACQYKSNGWRSRSELNAALTIQNVTTCK